MNEWRDWMYCRPPRGFLVQAKYQSGEPFVLLPEDMAPESNVAGLSWRFTGIGRMKFDALPPHIQDQLLQPMNWSMANLASAAWGPRSMGLLGPLSEQLGVRR